MRLRGTVPDSHLLTVASATPSTRASWDCGFTLDREERSIEIRGIEPTHRRRFPARATEVEAAWLEEFLRAETEPG